LTEDLTLGDATDGAASKDDAGRLTALTEVSRAMVRLYKEQFGRGPVRARSIWAGPDILITVLEETLTPAELNLRDLGEHQRLRDMRLFFQWASVSEFIEPVERFTGRTVRSFTSAIDTEEDVSVETFILYPRGAEGVSRAAKDDKHRSTNRAQPGR
jgi:uncharacterized protein YbcI